MLFESVHSAQYQLWPDYAYRAEDEAANTFLIVIFNKWSVHWAAQSLENTLKFSPNTFAVLIFLINGSYKAEQIKQD